MPTFNMRVFRGNKDGGQYKEYQVEAEEGQVILDVIHTLQATQARTTTTRCYSNTGKSRETTMVADTTPPIPPLRGPAVGT